MDIERLENIYLKIVRIIGKQYNFYGSVVLG